MNMVVFAVIFVAFIVGLSVYAFISEFRNRGEIISSLKKDIANQEKQLGDHQDRILSLSSSLESSDQKYMKLARAYMLARKKSEVEIIEEIDMSILQDYEELGSENIPAASYIASAMADFYTIHIKDSENCLEFMRQQSRSMRVACIREDARMLVERAKNCQYAYESALAFLLNEHPELDSDYVNKRFGLSLRYSSSSTGRDVRTFSYYRDKAFAFEEKCRALEAEVDALTKTSQEYEEYKKRWHLLHNSVLEYKKEFSSNLTAIPYMSKIFADAQTLHLDKLAWQLDWGNNQERQKKVASLNALKKQAKEEIERIKIAEYQLAYLLELYPALQDVIDTEYSELNLSFDDVSDCDPARHYMEREEWEKLSATERNQLALDRYIESRRKSKWQIGRDYELYCGYVYEKKGWSVDYFGSYNGLEDLGRDLILTKDGNVKIVQCKYWSHTKQIHENHIMQLYGSVIEYNLENKRKATGTLVTNTTLSEKAKDFARVLGIEYKENYALGDFPRIKCNIGRGERGEKTKIYHLPFDQQYDSAKVEREGEFMAMTVAEAEKAGFRRAYKWHGEE